MRDRHRGLSGSPRNPRKPLRNARLEGVRRAGRTFRAAIAPGALLLLLGLHGCGEQDLYHPPDSPFEIAGRVAVPGEPQDVAVLGNYAYVPMEQGGLQSVDISDPANPTLAARAWSDQRMRSIVAAQTYDADGTPRALAFVTIGAEGLAIYDITSPDSLVETYRWNGYYTESVGVVLDELITNAYRVFVADGRRGLTVLFQDLDVPGAARFIDGNIHRTYTEGYANAVAFLGGYAYVADDQMGVSIVDASDPTPSVILELIGNFDTPGEALDVAAAGNYVFVADGDEGMHIFRIGQDPLLERVATVSLSGGCQAIALHNGAAFIAAEDAGLHIIDVRDPEHPAISGTVPTSYAVGVDVSEHDIVCVADRDDGLIVFRNPQIPPDFTPPADVTDLTPRLLSTTSLELTWTAPGDDDWEGQAGLYDLRWSHEPIDASTWDAADPVIKRPRPAHGRERQSFTIEDLTEGAVYYFALKTQDESANWSSMSNVATVLMATHSLTEATVDPIAGDPATIFTYSVVYTHPQGEAPLIHNLLIDSVSFEMTATDTSGGYAAGVIFEYATSLAAACHEYQFSFDDGHGALLTTNPLSGPVMEHDPFDYVMRLIDVSGGATFTMGSPEGELGRDTDEVEHEVTLTRSYLISDSEVTQGLYEELIGESPSWFECSRRPVEGVTWYDAIFFCNALSQRGGHAAAYTVSDEEYRDGQLIRARVTWDPNAAGYRLPTEAEWEYACRAGSVTSLANGALGTEGCELDAQLDAIGWYCGNSDIGTGPKTWDARAKEANAFGIHDMHGNVWEWCWDRYAEYPSEPVSNPRGPEGEIEDPCVRRGGHWEDDARDCRSASRDWFYPNSSDLTTGFRIARNAD